MSKFLFSTLSLTLADGAEEPFDLEYFVLESQTQSESINISTYGIEIVKTQRSEGIKYIETKTMNEVCASEKTIYQIVRLLSDNAVTPITLEEVIEDYMATSGPPNTKSTVSVGA